MSVDPSPLLTECRYYTTKNINKYYDGAKKIMVALNNNANEKVLNAGRFRKMLQGVSGGVDVLTGQRFDLRTEVRLPAKSEPVRDHVEPTLHRPDGPISRTKNHIWNHVENSVHFFRTKNQDRNHAKEFVLFSQPINQVFVPTELTNKGSCVCAIPQGSAALW